MNVIILIPDNGRPREAVPVRAVPWVTGWSVSPDRLCIDLARDHEDFEPKLKGAVAYHLDRGNPVVLAKEWDFVRSALRALEEELDAEGAARNTSYQAWRHRSTLALPSAVFMWADELRAAFESGYGSRYCWTILNEREGDRELNFCPMLPDDLRSSVMEGFGLTPSRAQELQPSADSPPPQGTSENDDVAAEVETNWRENPKLLKSEKQDRAVMASIQTKGWNPLAVPDGEKGTIKALCELEYPELFSAGTAFETTWKRGLKASSWRMQSHASYAKRGKD
jgi:hypothetical protein